MSERYRVVLCARKLYELDIEANSEQDALDTAFRTVSEREGFSGDYDGLEVDRVIPCPEGPLFDKQKSIL